MISRRMIATVITGSILGIFCIIGANLRFGGELEIWFLFSFWLNRVAMGFVFGLLKPEPIHSKLVIRGVLIGLFISFLFYSATNFTDLTGFLVGAVYGVIIELVAEKFKDKVEV